MANVQGEVPPDLISSKPLKKPHDETTEESTTETSRFYIKTNHHETRFSSSHQQKNHDTGAYHELAESNYGTGNITKSIGVLLKPQCLTTHKLFYDPTKDYIQGYTQIGNLIKDPSVKVKVRPLLISFSGLPESSKSTALRSFLDNHVEKCPYQPITDKSTQPGAGITQYELIADGSDPHANFTLSEAMKESYFTFGLLTAFKNILALEQGKPVLDIIKCPEYFEDDDLESCLSKIHWYFSNESSIPKTTSSVEYKTAAALGLAYSLPECLALINIWDHSISNVVRHLLTALQGHLYNHYMFLFLDLERDLKNLDKPPKITRAGTDGAVFMKWRPRLHYLLRSAWATEKKGERKIQTCTLFAKNNGPYTKKVKKDIDDLVDLVNPVAKHIRVANLLDKKIEVVDVKSDHKRIYRKIQRIADDVPIKNIPLSWVFLRSSFLFSHKVFISKKELKKKANECGIDEISLLKFCKFYTSFGSIIDLSLSDSQCEYVLVKPITFLKKLSEFIYPKDDTFERYPSMKLGIVPEEVCKNVFGDHDWFSVMTALESLNLVTRITNSSVELPAALTSDFFLERNEVFYYISLCCKGDLVTEVDTNSVHLITSIDTPHFFKQVTLVKYLLTSLKTLQPKIVPCTEINQTIIKATTTDTTVTFTFHSPIIRIHLDKPDNIILLHVVQAFNAIAKKAFDSSELKVKYKFVRMCAAKKVERVDSLLSSLYHTLPYDGHCDKCIAAGRNDELLKVWTEVLEKNQVPEVLRPTGLIKSSELTQIAVKISKYCNKGNIDLEEIASSLGYKEQFYCENLTNEERLNEILEFWQNTVSQNNNGGSEPRRLLAKRLLELGETIFKRSGEHYIRLKFEKLAKSIDVYLRSNDKQIHANDIPKISVILQSVEDDWYLLGESLNVNKSILDDIKKKDKRPLECVLQAWCKEGEGTLTHLEKGLKMIKKEDLIQDLQGYLKCPTADKGVQFNYVIQSIDNLCDIHIVGKKLFLFRGKKPQLFNWEEYGLRVGVSEGTLSPDDTIEISVAALVGGQFVFPKNTKLVSAVYAICVSKPDALLQPWRLEVQHCVNLTKENQTKYLKFAIARLSTHSLPYQFSIVEGGQFTVGSCYGSISRTEFCLVGVFGKVFKSPVPSKEEGSREESFLSRDSSSEGESKETPPETTATNSLELVYMRNGVENEENKSSPEINFHVNPDSITVPVLSHVSVATSTSPNGSQESTGIVEAIRYVGLVYYEEKRGEDLVTFAAGKDLDALKKYVKREYLHAEIGQVVHFTFKEMNSFVELKFGEPQTKPCTGWIIDPHLNPPRLYQDDIDNFGTDNAPAPSYCLISVYAESPDAVRRLHYGVPLEGVVRPVTFFIRRSLRTTVTGLANERLESTTDEINPSDVLRKNISKLSNSLGAASTFLRVAEEFFSEGLIPFDVIDDVTSITGCNSYEKGSKVIIAVYKQMRTSPNQSKVLSTICDILMNQDNVQLKDIACSMRV